ncbi:MAG: prepilin-type N-terminal cleavage/methylation domain-containing protein [Candidatus Kaelpia aquatica]|nr:prepilin-type N-terminal cleavage/methylation domain-containing protein [Candidatus Kaelpia aquatica]
MFPSKSKKSFTLVEVIVAVVIVSLIFSLSSSLIWLSFRLSVRSKEVAVRFSGIRNVFEILSNDLRSACIFDYNEEPNFIVDSENKTISFWIIRPSESVETSYLLPILKISYFVKEEAGKKVLYKRLESEFEDYKKEILVYEADFEFSALIYSEDKKELLTEQFYSDSKLPEAIKIKCVKDENEIEKIIYIPAGKSI